MMKKGIGIICTLVLFTFLFLNIFLVSAANLNVCDSGCNYTTIQSAINNANSGDVVNVSAGIYHENQILIDKSVSVIGADKDTTIIDGSKATLSSTGLVRITATGNVLFANFTLNNAGGEANGGDGNDGLTNVGIYAQSNSSTAVYTIINNKIYGTNNVNDEEDYGLYSNSGEEKLIFTKNIISKTGGNSILIEKHPGETEISFNMLDAGIYGIDSIFYMTYGNINVTKLQNIYYNTIDMSTGGTDRATAISFMSSYSGSGPIGDGKYTNIQISYNTINNLKNNKRGISLYNDAFGDGKAGEIKDSIIKGNKIYGNGKPSNFAIRLAGYVTDTIISENYIKDCDQSFYGTSARNNFTAYPTGTIVKNNSFEGNEKFIWDGLVSLDAKNNWWGSCEDPSSKIIGNVSFNPWLGACIENKIASKNCIFSSEAVILYANVSSLVCIGNVIFSYNTNGIWKNVSGVVNSGIGNYMGVINKNYLMDGEDVLWTVYADDCYGHQTKDSISSFHVSLKTNLTTIPKNPEGLNGWYISEPLFILLNPETSSIFYRWDSAQNQVYISPFGLESTPNNGNLTGGIFELNYFSNTTCGLEPEENKIFKVDLTNPVVKNLVPADKSVIYNNKRPTIQAYLDEVYAENSGIDKFSIIMKVNGVKVDKTISDSDILDAVVRYNPVSDLLEGLNSVTINVSDKAGRKTQFSWIFYINTSAADLNLTVLLPENKNYNTKKVKISLTTISEAAKIEYINYDDKMPKFKLLCLKCKEYGSIRDKTLILNEGSNSITIRATDKFGNTDEKNIELFIDSIKPVVSMTKPIRNSLTKGEFYIKYNEDNLKAMSIIYGNDHNFITKDLYSQCNESGKNKECFFNLNISDFNGQDIMYWFNLSDNINSVISKQVKVKVDTSVPEININNPADNYTYLSTRGNILFNISVNENTKIEYYDSSDIIPRWTILCGNCNKYVRIKRLRLGEHEIFFKATDKSGNSAVEKVSFNVK